MFSLTDEYRFSAAPDQLWAEIFDPDALARLIPGCESLTQVGPDAYHGTIKVGIAAVSGAYETTVRIREVQPPDHCRLQGEVSGPTGNISGEASFELIPDGEGTLLRYQGQGLITGALGKMNPRIITSAVRSLIRQSFKKLDAQFLADSQKQAEIH
jgi:carbon monoxide dehydrogenase subunit G